jgi:hypothetical protein
LAKCFERGVGVTKDLARAKELFRQANEAGEVLDAVERHPVLELVMERLRNKRSHSDGDGDRGILRRSGGDVYLSPGVVIVPGGMLRGCSWVTSVVFGSGCEVGMISDYAFYETGIMAIRIPCSVEVVGIASFANCRSLNSVEFEPGALRIICEDAFWGTGIRAVSIPESVARVDDWSFAWCSRLKHVDFEGRRPKEISESAFEFTPYRVRNAKNADAGRLVWPSGVRRSVSLHNLSEVRAVLGCPSVSEEERRSCYGAMLKGDQLRRSKRHFDAQSMYLIAVYGFGRSEHSRVLRIMIQRGMEVFAEIPIVGQRVIERLHPIFSAVRHREVCGSTEDAFWELRAVLADPGAERRLGRYAAFLMLVFLRWDTFMDLWGDAQDTLDLLLCDTSKWKHR